ncbi:MAG: signal peptidase I, partial [Candidatus Spyradocola sp.]
ILVRQTAPDQIQPGDVITFFSQDPALNGALNTHRVARVEQQGDNLLFITKGDANQIEDPIPVTQDTLVGRVVFVSTALGVLVSLLTNPLVFGLLILLPLLILLILNLVRTVRLSAKLAREEEEKAIREALDEARKKRASNEKTES